MDKRTAKYQLKELGVNVFIKDIENVVSIPNMNYKHEEFASSVFHIRVLMKNGDLHSYDAIFADETGTPSPYSAKQHIPFDKYKFIRSAV